MVLIIRKGCIIMSKSYDIESMLSKKGCKNTKLRKAVIGVLDNANVPMSAEEIFLSIKKTGASINLSTVYRNLELMEKKGLVEKTLINDNKSRFELTKHGHRHHLICTDCNRMVALDICPIENIEQDVKDETDFDITGHQLVFYGICPECKKEN
jgi:Fur family ferric uptake transcriptional regulator